jgi:hypothetical protein
MFYDKRKFPILDIRVWKILYGCELVTNNARGQNFTLQQCVSYYKVIRTLAKQYRCPARQIEKKLYDHSINIQIGTLC